VIGHRTQPYRASAPRMPGMVLDAMLAGRRPGQLNPADFDRQRRQQARLQDLVGQQMQRREHPPVASADVRGLFGGGRPMPRGWSDPHVQQVLEQLLAASGPTRVF